MRSLIIFLLILIPATCIGQGTWNTRQDFNQGLRVVGNVTVDNIYVSAGDTIVSIAGHDFLLSDIRLKLDISDTAAMLVTYIDRSDTAAMLAPYLLSADIAGKLDISDTAAMLTNYSLLSEAILPEDTAAMLTPYALLSEANNAFNSGSGITIDGSNNIDLGGALDAPTVISGTEVNRLSLNFSDASDRSSKLVFRPADGLSMRAYTGDDYTGDSGFFAVDSSIVTMAQHNGASEKSIKMDTAVSTGIVVRDYVGGKGLVFFDDYSPSYGARSITDYEWQGTHLGYQNLDATIYSPGLAQHGGVLVYDSTGYATGTDHYQIETFVPANEAAGIDIRSCDTVYFAVTTVDTLLTLAEGTVIHDIEIWIDTPFDGSGTNLLDVGIIGDGDKYHNDFDLESASGMYRFANLPDRMSEARYIICQYTDSGADAAAGQAYIYVHYTIY